MRELSSGHVDWPAKPTSADGAMKSWQRAGTEQVHAAASSIGTRIKALSVNAQTQMRQSPAKWTGIATGVGLALGLLGRLLHRRARRTPTPRVVIIDAAP